MEGQDNQNVEVNANDQGGEDFEALLEQAGLVEPSQEKEPEGPSITELQQQLAESNQKMASLESQINNNKAYSKMNSRRGPYA